MARFLFATMPLAGHVMPGVPIARALVARGHEVRWYTGKKFKSRVEASGARFVAMTAAHDFDDGDLNAAFPGRADVDGRERLKFDLKHVFTDAVPHQLEDLEATLREFPADAVINDTAFMGVPLLSERSGVPYATFGVTALTLPSPDTAPFGLGLLPSGSAVGRLRNRALNWAVDRLVFRDVMDHYRAMRARLGFAAVRDKGFFDTAVGPYLYLQATVPSFEYRRRNLPPQVHFIGPLLPDEPAPPAPPAWWRDVASARRPVVHVTQGTVAHEDFSLLRATMEGLAGEDVLVVATMGGKPVEALGLAKLPANVRVERFLHYPQLMPHLSAMVTNCGYGGVQWALAHGVPLVGAGTTEDKPEVASRIGWSGVGINLRTATPTPARVRDAVRRLLAEPSYRMQARRLQAEIARHDAPERAVMLLEKLVVTKRPVLNATGPFPAQDRAVEIRSRYAS